MEKGDPHCGNPADPASAETVLYRVRPGYTLREIAGEYLAIPVTMQDGPESRVVVLNGGGRFLWEQLQKPVSIAALIRAMTDGYDVTAEEAERDIREYLEYLRVNKILTIDTEEKE